jgi:hypothetical protein
MEERITEPAAAAIDPAPVLEQPAEPQPSAPWYRRRNPLIVAAAAVVAAGIGIGLALSNGPSTIQITGVLALGPFDAIDTTSTTVANGDACESSGGYTDITAGTAVVVGNGTGQTIGTGGLQAGIEANVDDTLGTPAGNCVFQFAVTVPAGESAYTVTISHRGTTTLTPDQVKNGILLTLDAG